MPPVLSSGTTECCLILCATWRDLIICNKGSHLGQKPGGSDFLRKRLQKGQKYFDSGDYNMAKAKMKNKQLPAAAPDKTEVTGDHIPTPQDLPQRKPSLVASKLAG